MPWSDYPILEAEICKPATMTQSAQTTSLPINLKVKEIEQ